MSNLKVTAVNYALGRLAKIPKEKAGEANSITAYKQIAKGVHRILSGASLHYYRDGLKEVRHAIRAANYKHYALKTTRLVGWSEFLPTKKKKPSRYHGNSVSFVIKYLPEYADDLKNIVEMPALTILKGKSELLRKIEGDLNRHSKKIELYIDLVENMTLEHPVIPLLVLSKAKKRLFNRTTEKALEKIGKIEKIYNCESIIKEAVKRINSKSYTDITWGLAVLTGRRANEILFGGTIIKIDDKSVMFSGQSKKREGVVAESYAIPTLVDADLVIGAWAKLRGMDAVKVFRTGTVSLDGKQRKAKSLTKRELNKAINQRVGSSLNLRAKDVTGDPAEKFKNTRSIYARYCSDNIRNTEERWCGNEDRFLMNILGHSKIDQIKHYRQVSLKYGDNGAWLKIHEKQAKKAKKEAPKVMARRNMRAGTELKRIGELLDEMIAAGETHVEIQFRGKMRKVSLIGTDKQQGIRDWHVDKLKYWAYENSTRKITQSACTKNIGHTKDSGTGTVNVRVGRHIFAAWVKVAGELLDSYNNHKMRN